MVHLRGESSNLVSRTPGRATEGLLKGSHDSESSFSNSTMNKTVSLFGDGYCGHGDNIMELVFMQVEGGPRL